jgi:aryl-alcohol dehydrogenase-like predicted oxidoreductase
VDDAEAVAALHRAIELGVTLLDTADSYGAGHSERLLSTVLAAHPEVLVATKFGNTFDEETRQLTGADTSPARVRDALHASLRRLGRDRIDLYQLHTPDVDERRAEELITALEGFVAEGLIAWYGISTDDPAQATRFAAGAHCTAAQLQLSVLDDNAEMLAVCDRCDLAALCRSPLAMGLLGGRYTAASVLPADDIRGQPPAWLRWFTDGRPNAEYLERVEAIRELLTADGRTVAQGAIGWIWARHSRTIPLPGFRNTAQAEENAAALIRGALAPEVYAAINSVLERNA